MISNSCDVIVDGVAANGRIVLTRPGDAYRDKFRAYRLEVDGVRRAKIRAGQTVEVEVEPGMHVVQARISWTGSQARHIDIAPGQEVLLRVEPAGTPAQALGQVLGQTTWLDLKVIQTSSDGA